MSPRSDTSYAAHAASGNAVIGWKATPEARRTAYDMVVLAGLRAEVTVVTVGSLSDEARVSAESAAEDVRNLQHGSRAEWKQLGTDGLRDIETQEKIASGDSSGLRAIDAFGHSGFRELTFGGVTLTSLEKVRLPIVVSQ